MVYEYQGKAEKVDRKELDSGKIYSFEVVGLSKGTREIEGKLLSRVLHGYTLWDIKLKEIVEVK
ncbi:hypothetical protein HN832_03705 [archaeon]|nr:hypothetical protein [archaeon]MBT4373500.1 hypothetical protein [archaeon]MBT4531948.1 hypothetical protein [archaeon]MBT7001615.1 hypothetical protein [archaeon]MBT7282493.1 hypothetical protein [archaeon]